MEISLTRLKYNAMLTVGNTSTLIDRNEARILAEKYSKIRDELLEFADSEKPVSAPVLPDMFDDEKLFTDTAE